MTLITVPLGLASTISNMLASLLSSLITNHRLRWLEIALKPFPHAPQRRSEPAGLTRQDPALELRLALGEQSHRGRVAWALHDVGEPAHVARDSEPHRHVEDLLPELDHPLHHRRATGEHDPRRQQLLEAGLPQHLLHERVELLDARLDHLGERLPRELPRRAVA